MAEAAGQGADVFVAHFLRSLGGKCGTPKAFGAAMTDDHRVWVGYFFFDIDDFTPTRG